MTRPSPRPRPTPGVRTTDAGSGAAPDPAADTASAVASEAVSDPAPPRPSRVARRRAARSHRSRRLRTVVGLTGAVLALALALVVSVTVIRRNLDVAAPAAPAPSGSSAFAADTAVLTDESTADGFVAGASSIVPVVTSYDYRDLDSALSDGLAVTTGEYRAAYRSSLQGALGAAARRDRLVQTFEVLNAGIGEVAASGRSAKVLIFGVQTVTSESNTAADRTVSVTLTATVVRQGDRYLIQRLEVGANAGLPPGSPQLAVAAETARRQVIDLLSYRRADFDADYQRALAGAVDPLRASVVANAADTRAAMDKGRYDLAGTVTAVAVQRASGTSVLMLVAATGTRVAQDGAVTVDDDARVSVLVVRVAGGWRVGDVQPVVS